MGQVVFVLVFVKSQLEMSWHFDFDCFLIKSFLYFVTFDSLKRLLDIGLRNLRFLILRVEFSVDFLLNIRHLLFFSFEKESSIVLVGECAIDHEDRVEHQVNGSGNYKEIPRVFEINPKQDQLTNSKHEPNSRRDQSQSIRNNGSPLPHLHAHIRNKHHEFR